MEAYLSDQFCKAFMELFVYQQMNPNKILPAPMIIQTCVPHTFLLYFGQRNLTLNIPSLNKTQAELDILQKAPQLLLNENQLNINQVTVQEPPNEEPLEIEQQVPKVANPKFQSVPAIPQFTAQQISKFTGTQLTSVISMIKEDELDEDELAHLNSIKKTLNIPISEQKPKTKPAENTPKKTFQSDNKNIPKNFTKAMFTYSMSNKELAKLFLMKHGLQNKEDQFIEWLKENKKIIHNTKQLKTLNQSSHEFCQPFKLLQQHFLKHNTACYIFNSRIENTSAHIKARSNIIKQLFLDAQPEK